MDDPLAHLTIALKQLLQRQAKLDQLEIEGQDPWQRERITRWQETNLRAIEHLEEAIAATPATGNHEAVVQVMVAAGRLQQLTGEIPEEKLERDLDAARLLLRSALPVLAQAVDLDLDAFGAAHYGQLRADSHFSTRIQWSPMRPPKNRRTERKCCAHHAPALCLQPTTLCTGTGTMSNQDNKSTLPGLTTEIVTAYLRNHAMAAADVPVLVTTVARELGGLGREPEEPAQPEPVVSLRRSVQRDHLVCLICGKKLKSLRRHLAVAHDLTPSSYRKTFGLKRDYPIVAPAYAEQRSEVARRTGLGRRGEPGPQPAPQQEAPPEARRGRRGTRKAQASTDAAAAPKSRRGRRSSHGPAQTPSSAQGQDG